MTVFHNDAPEMGIWSKRGIEKSYYNGNINSEKNKGSIIFGRLRQPRSSGTEGTFTFSRFLGLPRFLDGKPSRRTPMAESIQGTFPASSFCYAQFSTFCSPDGECVIALPLVASLPPFISLPIL